MSGYLELIIGPMFAGKTTKLVEIYNNHSNDTNKVIAVNYTKDTRHSQTMMATHDKVEIPCIFIDKLHDILNYDFILYSNIILINEGQFFEDIYDTVKYLVDKLNKAVYISGLDGDFKRNKFGNLLDLIPLCDNIVKLHSKCKNCNNDAIFSHRTTTDETQVVIGAEESYIPLCRSCYIKMNNLN